MTTSWSFGGTNLATAFGKVTVIDDYLNFSDRRGDNIDIPFNHGSIHVGKYFKERVIVLGIAMIGTSASDLETKFDTLKTLLSSKSLQTLSNTREDTTIRTIQASVDKSLNIERNSDRIAGKVIIEFTAPSAFFRLSTIIADNETVINASPKAMVVTNPGSIEETAATIILTGPLLNTVITNSTNSCTLTYTGSIPSPRIVTISKNTTGEFVATDDLGTNVIGNITHSGAPALMVFNPGTNNLSITDGVATTGKVKVTFYAPFL